MIDEYYKYLQRVSKHVDNNSKLRNNINVVCACETSCKLNVF